MYQTGVKSWYTGVNTILKELNLNETNCNQAKFSLINMYKIFWCNKLENEAVFKKEKLRTFYGFQSVFPVFLTKGGLISIYSSLYNLLHVHVYLSLVMKKSVFGVSDQVRHKPG